MLKFAQLCLFQKWVGSAPSRCRTPSPYRASDHLQENYLFEDDHKSEGIYFCGGERHPVPIILLEDPEGEIYQVFPTPPSSPQSFGGKNADDFSDDIKMAQKMSAMRELKYGSVSSESSSLGSCSGSEESTSSDEFEVNTSFIMIDTNSTGVPVIQEDFKVTLPPEDATNKLEDNLNQDETPRGWTNVIRKKVTNWSSFLTKKISEESVEHEDAPQCTPKDTKEDPNNNNVKEIKDMNLVGFNNNEKIPEDDNNNNVYVVDMNFYTGTPSQVKDDQPCIPSKEIRSSFNRMDCNYADPIIQQIQIEKYLSESKESIQASQGTNSRSFNVQFESYESINMNAIDVCSWLNASNSSPKTSNGSLDQGLVVSAPPSLNTLRSADLLSGTGSVEVKPEVSSSWANNMCFCCANKGDTWRSQRQLAIEQ